MFTRKVSLSYNEEVLPDPEVDEWEDLKIHIPLIRALYVHCIRFVAISYTTLSITLYFPIV